ncbi:MAG: cytochrome c oxidase assembly protein [Micavibrio aeruginosavorus]|uniref:Cytochrome c oxidase assembly protein CtaG n=1 Tax=Micavibrio aeruginosavorus TaxID=349221 RepID=A0A2W5FQM1_9BACT|nr:MAG: cytochrome c oxidase assembly protein [Micavibrio aeruginosavorus]
MSKELQDKNRRTGLAVLALILGMLILSYASVPLYRLFCQVTGFGGKAEKVEAANGEIFDREITVRFNSDVNPNLPWDFKPDTPEVKVKVGQEMLISFTATNLSREAAAGTAMYNVTPGAAGKYFNKTQCFCFNYQLIAPGRTVHFPVVFYIDPKIMKDRENDGLKTITLSYTFFKADSPELEQALEAFYNDPKSANKAIPVN